MLTEDATTTIEHASQRSESWGTQEQAAWYAIYTRSHFENLVADQLTARGFSLFLPQRGVWSKRLRTSRVVPMFPGYLFIHQGMEKRSYIEILKARGVVRVLEGGWNRLTPIADVEMERRRAGVASYVFQPGRSRPGVRWPAHRPRRHFRA